MGSKSKAKREALRFRLVDAAEARIAEQGLRGLKARDVTADAGCSLGALYNVVEDLDRLVILVNSRTLNRLGDVLRKAVPDDATPTETIQSLAHAYIDFAVDNSRLWSAIFFHRLPDDVEIPDWYKKEHAVLIEQIIAPLAEMRPDLGPEALRLRAQTMFAAVHGVVQLSFHGQHVGTPSEFLKSEVEALVEALTRGIHLVDSLT